MNLPKPIAITKLIDSLLDDNTPFPPLFINRLSDLAPEDAALLADAWPKVSLRRREALLEDLEETHLADDLLSFEAVGRLALKDDQPSIRIQAISILDEYELVDLLPVFVDMAEYDPDSGVRSKATSALGIFIYMGEVDDISSKKLKVVEECLLRQVSGSDNSLVRRKALEALGFSSREEVGGLIADAYSSKDIEWLISSLTAMGRSANSDWNPNVIKMLNHTRPEVRAEAASAAGELEIRSALPELLDLLEDSDLDVRMAAIWSLSQVGGRGVRKALEDLLETTDNDEESNQIENALENLDFTEEMQELKLLDISENGDGSSDDEVEEDDDDELISEDELD
jgi:HEAT repeat protein